MNLLFPIIPGIDFTQFFVDKTASSKCLHGILGYRYFCVIFSNILIEVKIVTLGIHTSILNKFCTQRLDAF